MRWTAFEPSQPFGSCQCAAVGNADQDYGVLIISRERLEVPTNCEVGVYIDDQLAGRLFQEQALAFNLPPASVDIPPQAAPRANPTAACPACWCRPRSGSP